MLGRVLVDRETLENKVAELAGRISADYEGCELVLIGVLNGGAVFMSDLMRQIRVPVEIDYIAVSSYRDGSETTGEVKVKKDTELDLAGRHVLIVEDLIDTGLTLKFLKETHLASRGAASVRLCTILDKPARRRTSVEVEYGGIEIPDEFVVGYGLDYAGKYRNLPEVYTVEP